VPEAKIFIYTFPAWQICYIFFYIWNFLLRWNPVDLWSCAISYPYAILAGIVFFFFFWKKKIFVLYFLSYQKLFLNNTDARVIWPGKRPVGIFTETHFISPQKVLHPEKAILSHQLAKPCDPNFPDVSLFPSSACHGISLHFAVFINWNDEHSSQASEPWIMAYYFCYLVFHLLRISLL
jgi:hypothetical protein